MWKQLMPGPGGKLLPSTWICLLVHSLFLPPYSSSSSPPSHPTQFQCCPASRLLQHCTLWLISPSWLQHHCYIMTDLLTYTQHSLDVIFFPLLLLQKTNKNGLDTSTFRFFQMEYSSTQFFGSLFFFVTTNCWNPFFVEFWTVSGHGREE